MLPHSAALLSKPAHSWPQTASWTDVRLPAADRVTFYQKDLCAPASCSSLPSSTELLLLLLLSCWQLRCCALSGPRKQAHYLTP